MLPTVATDSAAAFTTAYPGVTPSYSVVGATMVAVAVSGTPTLTNAGEPIILFGANERACRKQGGPAGRIRQIQQQIPALLGIQPERAQGSGDEHLQRQTDMAAPQLEAGERSP